MTIILGANIALRFLLELWILAALGYWGFQTGRGTIIRISLGLGAPLLAAVFWGVFIAPGSDMQVSEPLRLALEVVVFGSAAAVLYATNHARLAWALVAIGVINRFLMYVWHQ
jgi:hypothetical protein